MENYKYAFPWYCPECKCYGTVYFDNNVDIWLVVQKVTENHKKVSPTCSIWWSYLKTGKENVQNTVKSNIK